MKSAIQTIAIVIAFLLLACVSNAQTAPAPDLLKNAKYQKDTVMSNQTLKIYVGTHGGRFVIVTSKKTGNPYKRYLPKTVATKVN